MNRSSLLAIVACSLLSLGSLADSLPDKLAVEWIHGDEARLLTASPDCDFAGERLLCYDERLPEGERTIELVDPETGDVVVRVDRVTALASLSELVGDEDGEKEAESADDEELGAPGEVSRDGRFGLYSHDDDLFVLDFAESKFRRLTTSDDKEKSARFSPDGSSVAFVRENDLWILDLASGKERRLTRGGSETTLNGTLSWVYWEELFGRRDRGYEFSPDSSKIAFYQFDESMVDVMTFVDPRPDATKVIRQRYPKAGTTNPRVRGGVIDVESGKTTWIDLGGLAYEYLARLVWTPDGRSVVVQTLDRPQTSLDVFLADAATGKTKHLFRDTDTAWIDVRDDLVWLDDGNRFLWVSSRGGHDHIYLYEMTAEGARLVRQVTSGDWSVIEAAERGFDGLGCSIAGVDEDQGVVYFTSTRDSHLETHLYGVKLDGKRLSRLTEEPGVHSIRFDPAGRYFVDSHSSLTRPPGIDLRTPDGKRVRSLMDPSRALADHFEFSQPELVTTKADDGFELTAMVMKPAGFDASKRYPVIVNVYGGPAAPRVRNRWQGSLFDQLLCAEGYLLFTIDPRTSTAMGKPTTRLLLRDFYGEKEAADIVAGVRWLKTQPGVDPERVGVTGWSGGGSTTLSVMTRSREFRAGIAGAGVYDYRLYDTIYTERYMKHPEDNVEGYEHTALASRAKDLHGRLMLIHGSYDDNVHPQNTWRLVDELVKNGRVFDLVIYPMQKHGFRGDEARLHLSKARLEFWQRELSEKK
jgi:dipeptidyl-peptidase-4